MGAETVFPEVGVVDPLPSVRRDVRLALENAGFSTCDPPADLAAYVRGRRRRAAVVSLTGHFGLRELDQVIRANRQASIVALVDWASPDLYAELLRRASVYPALRSATPESIAECMKASLNGMCVLPNRIARQMANAMPAQGGTGLTREELSWLRRLGRAVTVEEIADDVGLSERSLYRRLRVAYRKLGVESRTEALLRLAQLGLLER